MEIVTVTLPETKRFPKTTRQVIAVYEGELNLSRVKDHVGEVWLCKKLADGNYKAVR